MSEPMSMSVLREPIFYPTPSQNKKRPGQQPGQQLEPDAAIAQITQCRIPLSPINQPCTTVDSTSRLRKGSADNHGSVWRGSGFASGALVDLTLNVFWSIKGARWRSNCREIEVPIDSTLLHNEFLDSCHQSDKPPNTMAVTIESLCAEAQPDFSCGKESVEEVIMPTARDSPPSDVFPFMSLPLELRLKVYSYLLPSRTHTIVSQYPHNGSYFSAASNINAFTQSLYPAQHTPTTSLPISKARQRDNLTTYKILNANFRRDFPHPSINPAILRTCSRIRAEAEPVLYGSQTVFDFGVFVDAVVPFFHDRGDGCKFVRNVRVAREIPASIGGEDVLWNRTCDFFREELYALRVVDLTVWSGSGEELVPVAAGSVAVSGGSGVDKEDRGKVVEALRVARWLEWDYVEGLTQAKGLREVRVTYWDFPIEDVTGFTANQMRGAFDGWLAKRMTADPLIKERMVKDGCVIEGVVVLPIKTSQIC